MEKKKLTEEELLRILQSKQEELSKLNEEKEQLESLNKDAKRIIEAQREREAEHVENPLNDPDNIDVTEEPEKKEESKKELTKEEALKQFFESKRTKKK
jgi:hypothetical protein